MNKETFNTIRKSVLEQAQSIYEGKGREYAAPTDVLANFKDQAKLLGITPQQVWAVFFYKHVSSLMKWAATSKSSDDEKSSDVLTESLDSRVADIINYAIFALALDHELRGGAILSDALQKLYESNKNLEFIDYGDTKFVSSTALPPSQVESPQPQK